MTTQINNKTAKAQRNSNVEIVRIFAMLSIIFSHLYATNSGESYNGIYLYIFEVIISVFHSGLGVSLFMIISGYFMINYTRNKLTKTISVTWCCSAFALIIEIILSILLPDFTVSASHVLNRLTPVTSVYYWYISCYIFLMLLTPFFNKAISKLSKKDYTTLICVLLVLFYILPTFLYKDIMGDKGKGLITMVCSYFIGAYLSKYKINLKKSTIIALIAALSVFNIAGNAVATIVRHSASYPFSRECSVTTLAVAVLIVMLATQKQTYNKKINVITSRTIYVYMLGCFITGTINKFGLVNVFGNSPLYLLFSIVSSFAVYALAFLLSYILQYPAMLVDKIINKVIEIAENIINKFLPRLVNKNENSDC